MTGHSTGRDRSFCWDTPFSRWFLALGRWDIGDYTEAFWDSAASTVPLMTWLADASETVDLVRESFRTNAEDLENFRNNVLMKALDGYSWLVGALCAETPDGVVTAVAGSCRN